MSVVDKPALTPRDVAVVASLKAHGLQLVEIKLSDFSPVLGRNLANLSYPGNSRAVCVIREQVVLTNPLHVTLCPGDLLYMLTDDEDAIRGTFL